MKFYYISKTHPKKDINNRVFGSSIEEVKHEISTNESDVLEEVSFTIFDITGEMVSYR